MPTATKQVSRKPQTSGNIKHFNLSSIQIYIRCLSIKKNKHRKIFKIKMPNICFSRVSRFVLRRSLEWWGARFQSGSPAPSLGVCPSGRPPTAAVLYRSSSLRKQRGTVKKNCKFIIACFKNGKCTEPMTTLTKQALHLLIRHKKGRTWKTNISLRYLFVITELIQNILWVHLTEGWVRLCTYLDIIQGCTTKCPKGICSLWPWERWWEQRTCGDVVRECNAMLPNCVISNEWLLYPNYTFNLF